MTIPVNTKNINNIKKPISPINKMEKYKKISDNTNAIKYESINLNIKNIPQNDYNYQKRISKIESKKEKEEKDDGLNFSMMKIFEQLIKNDSVKKNTKKIPGAKNENKAFERKKLK